MEYISRHLENRILETSKSFSAILLTGPRQSGKTTMLRRLAENENIGLDEEAALLIASVSDGAMRDALSLLDRYIEQRYNRLTLYRDTI